MHKEEGGKEMKRGRPNIRWVLTVLSILCFLGFGMPSIGVAQESTQPYRKGTPSAATPSDVTPSARIPSSGIPSIGVAEEGFHPYITVDETYTTNVDLAPNRFKRDDFLTTITPGLRFSTLKPNYGLDLDVRAGYVFYAHENERNYAPVNGVIQGWYALSPKLTFRAKNYTTRSEEPREQEFSATSVQNQFLLSTAPATKPYIRNVFEPSLEYRFGTENLFSLYYLNNFYHNPNTGSEDSLENYISPRLIYWFDIHNGISLQYGFLYGDFERSPDLVGHTANGRYTYRFNPKTSIFGDYTFLNRHFISASQNDYDVHTPTIGIEHAFSPTLKGMAQVGYFFKVPKEGSTTGGISYNVSLTQELGRISYTLLAQGGYTEDYFTAQNLGFAKYHRGIGTITYRLFRKMTVGLSGSIERAKIGTETEYISGIWTRASYEVFKWLTLSLEGSHRENHSTAGFNSYSEYRGIFRVTATY